MIAPTRAYDGIPALATDEAAGWMVTAALTRPVRIAPRKALALRALDVFAPRALNNVLARETNRMNANAPAAAAIQLPTNGQSAPSGLAGIDAGNQKLRDVGITQA